MVGSTYKLYVKMLTGQTYESTAETMKGVPEIENAITRFEIFDQYSKVDVRRAGFTVYLDFKDMPSEGDFYLWNWKNYRNASFCATCTDGGKFDFKKLFDTNQLVKIEANSFLLMPSLITCVMEIAGILIPIMI